MTAYRGGLTSADVERAAGRIARYARRTPLLPGLPAPGRRRGGWGLLLKAEHLQHSGSFKLRGAANAVLALGARAIVTGSSGNHGIALARLAAPMGVRVTVVLAAGTSPAKAERIRALGGRTVSVRGGVAEREERARALAEETGAVLVPSSDHELVVAGQGTVAREILADVPDVRTLYVPVGGGGLLAGVCLAARDHPVRIVGVEPAGTPRYARSLAAGRPLRLPPCDTVADGLRAQAPGEVPFAVVRDRVDDLVAVTDAEILTATDRLRRLGVEAEPSGAVALAGALRAGRLRERAVAVVSGGNTLAALTARTDLADPTGPADRAGPADRTDPIGFTARTDLADLTGLADRTGLTGRTALTDLMNPAGLTYPADRTEPGGGARRTAPTGARPELEETR